MKRRVGGYLPRLVAIALGMTFPSVVTADCIVIPTSLSFPPTQVGSSVQQSFSVTNNSAVPVILTIDAQSPFSVNRCAGIFGPCIIVPFGTTNVTCTFQPTSAGVFSETLTFSGDCGSPTGVPVTGTGVAAECRLRDVCGLGRRMTDFGEVPIGTSRDATFCIENSGSIPFSETLAVSCPEFTIVSGTSINLDVGESEEVTVRYTPTVENTPNARISLSCDQGLVFGTGLGDRIFWSGTNSVSRARLDGSDPDSLISGADVVRVAVDRQSGTLFYAVRDLASSNGVLVASRTDGSAPLLLTTLGTPGGLAIDPTFKTIYWADVENNQIGSCKFDGSNLFLWNLSDTPTDVAFNPRTGDVYWAEKTSGRLRYFKSGVETTLYDFAHSGGDYAVSIDSRAWKAYWTQGQSIHRVHLDGANPQQLLTPGSQQPVDLWVDAGSSHVYWADAATNAIHRVELDGSNPTVVLVDDDIQSIGLLVPEPQTESVFWTDNGKIVGADKFGNNVATVLDSIWVGSLALDMNAGHLYWVAADKIQRADLDGSNVLDVLTGLTQPSGLAIDVDASKLYWSDDTLENLQRASLDGSSVEVVLGTGLGSQPADVTLDLVNEKLYWIEASKIRRANIDGTNPEDVVTTAAFDLAVDPDAGHVYWVDGFDLHRVNVDGSDPQILPTGIQDPQGVDFDRAERRVYWTDSEFGCVMSQSPSGEGPACVVLGTLPASIVVAQRAGFPTTTDARRTAPSSRARLQTPQPNPFNPVTTISFSHAGGHVTLTIYDPRGRLVRSLHAGVLTPGAHSLVWDGRNDARRRLGSGIYFVRLDSGGETRSAKAVLLR